jgi:tetratricopeptide (TPR) repeat protein
VVLVLLVICVFMPALDAGLVDWDDDDLLVHNTRHRQLNADSLRWMFATSYTGHFQPLTWLTYALDWAVWKREWFGFHLTSVLLHALTAVAVYFVTRRLLTWTRMGRNAFRSTPVLLSAMFASALFAVHPLRVESVAWLAERRDVLAGLFFVLAVASYLRYVAAVQAVWPAAAQSGNLFARLPARRSARRLVWGWRCSYAGAVALCAVSLLAKASAATLPVVLLILDTYPLRRWRSPRGSSGSGLADSICIAHQEAASGKRAGHARIWLEKLPFCVLAAATGVRALIAQQDGGWLRSYAEYDVLQRFAQASYGLMFYLWKTFWPTNLGPLYEIPRAEILFGPMLSTSIAVVATVGLAALALKRRYPAVIAALAIYVVTLFPVLGVAQSGPQLVADRYSYLSCVGLAVLAGALLQRVFESGVWGRNSAVRAVFRLVPASLVVLLSRGTFLQADTWLSARTLWKRGVQVSPESSIANTNYADALARTELFAPAAKHYMRALELNPNDPVALHHYADLLKRFGRLDTAISLYLRALQVDPDRQNAAYALAQSLVSAGRAAEAVDVLRDGARRHPQDLEMLDYLAQLLSTYPDETVRDGEEATKWALQVNQAYGFHDVPALVTLATAYADAGRFADAIDTAEQALELANHNRDDRLLAQLNHRLTLFRQGKPYHFGE